jgi:putative membrane protein
MRAWQDFAVSFAAETDVWRFQAHPEVWVLVAGAVLLGWYTVRVVGPSAVRSGEPLYTRRNAIAYTAAIVALWGASDWPMHDVSEEYLYSVHMVQHMIFSLIVPPLLLVSIPEWLARLIMTPGGKAGVWVKRLTHPVVAGFAFNFVQIVTHLPYVVNLSIENGAFHYGVHTAVFATSLWMWAPVVSPIREIRPSLPAQMVYLFLMSIVPTVPAGFLTFAGGALYEAYDHPVRLWGIDVTVDQQMAGLIMKLGGGLYLWSWILVLFARWNKEAPTELVLVPSKPVDPDDPSGGDLTFEDVRAEFDRAGAAPTEP